MSSSSSSSSSSRLGAYFFAGSIVTVIVVKGFFDALLLMTKLQEMRTEHSKESLESSSNNTCQKNGDIFPPLPPEVVQTLSTAHQCFLATQNDGEPHLSLMRFTYYQQDEVVILTTRRNTKKYNQIVNNPKVALLIHDFEGEHHDDTSTRFSITLNGEVDTDLGADEEKYRSLHLTNNREYAQFIVGSDIAVLVVRIEKATICDINDKVRRWSAVNGFTK